MAEEAWRKIAIAEVDECIDLLFTDDDFTAADLCDRLQGMIDYLKLDPKANLIEGADDQLDNG